MENVDISRVFQTVKHVLFTAALLLVHFLLIKHKHKFINRKKFLQARKHWLFIFPDSNERNDKSICHHLKDKLFVKYLHLRYVLLLWKDTLRSNHYNKLFANESIVHDMVFYLLKIKVHIVDLMDIWESWFEELCAECGDWAQSLLLV